MRFKFDKNKSCLLRRNPKRRIGFEEARGIWGHPYYEDVRFDVSEQIRVIGWVKGKLYSLIYEVREDKKVEYYHLVTLWKSTSQEKKLYEKSRSKN